MTQVESLLGDLSGNGSDGPAPLEPVESDGTKVRLHTKESDQAHLCLGVLSYPLQHADRYALQLLAVVLGGGMSSRRTGCGPSRAIALPQLRAVVTAR